MRGRQRKLIHGVCLAAGVAAAAGAGAQTSDAERLKARVWLAESIRGVKVSAQSTIAFESAGKVTGSGGCNRMFGAAKVAGDNMTFASFVTTRMACAPPAVMQQEQKFLAALAATRTFRFTGTALRLYDASGAELVRFTERR
jgi:heat shock protein HslJ